MEMKKSYSPFGSTPLSVDEVLPDIQTGRAVYPDKDKEADASYMERINQYKHEGFHDVSEDGGSSGGDSSSGGGSAGYSCAEEWTTLTDESVTTDIGKLDNVVRGKFAYLEPITADIIKVTFNGTEYTCNKVLIMDTNCYGGIGGQGPDFSEYPFAIRADEFGNQLYTENAGTYQVKIEAFEEIIETSECFEKARGYSCSSGSLTLITSETINSEDTNKQNGGAV